MKSTDFQADTLRGTEMDCKQADKQIDRSGDRRYNRGILVEEK